MSRQAGLWELEVRGESSTSQFKSGTANHSSLWDYPAAPPTSGTAQYDLGSTANENHHTIDQTSMSGIGSSTLYSAAPDPANGNGDVKGKGKAPVIEHGTSLLNSGGLPPLEPTMAPFHSSGHSDHFSFPGHHHSILLKTLAHCVPPQDPSLMSPFAPGHYSYGPPSGGQPRRQLPSIFGRQSPGHDGPKCGCAICSSGPQAMCFQQQLAQQQASINAAWDEERARLEACRGRVELLVRQEGRIILDHHRQEWDEERGKLQSEIAALRRTIKELEDGHLQLCDDHSELWVENVKLEQDNSRLQEENSRLKDALSKARDVSDQAQGGGGGGGGVEGITVHHHDVQPAVHHHDVQPTVHYHDVLPIHHVNVQPAVHHDNVQPTIHHHDVQPTFTNPFEHAASPQGDRPRGYHGGRGFRASWTAGTGSTSWSASGGGRLRSSWPVQAPTRATSRSPPPAGILAPQDPGRIALPSKRWRVPMALQPEPLYANSPSPMPRSLSASPAPFSPATPIPRSRSDSPAPFSLATPVPRSRSGSPVSYHPVSPKIPFRKSPSYCPASPSQYRPRSKSPSWRPASPIMVSGSSLDIPERSPKRSPKRRRSVVDVNEVEAGLDGIPLRANTVRRATFAHNTPGGAPPLKRQRSLSQEYCIVDNPFGNDDEEGDGERDKEEVQRLKMHAGHTPPRSPPMRHSQGSPTPIAPSSPPEPKSVIIGETEMAEDSGDVALTGPLMIQNDPAEDESFLAALNEKLGPISQGVDALPRAVQPPIAMPVPVSAVQGERIVRWVEPWYPPIPEGKKLSNLQSKDGESDNTPHANEDDDGSDEATTVAEPEVPIKFRSTSNFGAPFGRM
ncbi:hypothetical protein BBK36DRAFT_1165034 [Trichoderma citrinoviride]|uniref:Uncharacterized protein n=1 Tax=Trichoderma citrinoviride TaxID=58853 RepID=A0A2T4BMG4_9HYPO|nr:hypothetical protein BBK36DRAFT_1165034 [Trichoderma citrinoviride]PTB70507.1 hypothetical protein BBK36DRAFT_1165034 [Trichoderma citrinoviride]